MVIEKHLDWSYRKPTGMISVFDNLSAAERRAHFLDNGGVLDIRIVRMSTDSLEEGVLSSPFLKATIHLPILTGCSTAFFPVAAANSIFGLDCPYISAEEWLALDCISGNLVDGLA